MEITIENQRLELEMLHVTFRLKFENAEYLIAKSSTLSSLGVLNTSLPPLNSAIMLELFPFHLIFNRSMKIISVGESLRLNIRHCVGEVMQDIFNLIRPYIEFNWSNVCHVYLSYLKIFKIRQKMQ